MSSTRQTRLTEFFDLGLPPLEEDGVEITISAPPLISDRLPELTDEMQEEATVPNQRQWIYKLMSFGPGWTHADIGGVTLQVIDRMTVRCIAVCDSAMSYELLALMKYGFEKMGFSMQIDPHAIIMEMPPPCEINWDGKELMDEKPAPNVPRNGASTAGFEVA